MELEEPVVVDMVDDWELLLQLVEWLGALRGGGSGGGGGPTTAEK